MAPSLNGVDQMAYILPGYRALLPFKIETFSGPREARQFVFCLLTFYPLEFLPNSTEEILTLRF